MDWQLFQDYYTEFAGIDFAIDLSRVGFPEGYLDGLGERFDKAFADMKALEGGAIANPDEGRMVGHYWLRKPELAPEPRISDEIRATLEKLRGFAAQVHSGDVSGSKGAFTNLLVIGIGGSALGPQFVADALGDPASDKLTPYFFDNTDPDGMERTLRQLDGQLGQTLAVVISKSGGTPETRNGMLEAEAAWKAASLDFARHAVAITGEGSKLDQHAESNGWLARFPMWDWVGGRTSETGPVGLFPAALQGLDIDALLKGAAQMDEATRTPELRRNPAALLAASWLYLTNGRGEKDMVVLPYKDRLQLFSKYLQQLVMESLGKERDLDGKVVHQGIAVYGNKGSTDQHAYVQQLREGVANFFATFIEVLRDRAGSATEVEPGTTAGDYLNGFLLGTREALSENGRPSVTLTVGTVDAPTVGRLIALFERAVGLYASLININAYHQPGVEAGKKAAATILDLKRRIQEHLDASAEPQTAEQIAERVQADSPEAVYKLLRHLAANKGVTMQPGSPATATFATA